MESRSHSLERLIGGLLALFLAIGSTASVSADTGGVCLGPNLTKALELPRERLFITIDNSEPLYFDSQNSQPHLVLDGLSLDSPHMVKVHFDGQIVKSWVLDFKKLGTPLVLIWRAAGSWRMEPVTADRCDASAIPQAPQKDDPHLSS